MELNPPSTGVILGSGGSASPAMAQPPTQPSKTRMRAVIGVIVVATLITVGLFAFTSNSRNGESAHAETVNFTPIEIAKDCTPQYEALDPNDPTLVNPDKEVPYAMGPRVFPVGHVVTVEDIIEAKKELDERRECGADNKYDTMLTATHYAEWSYNGLTTRSVAFADIDAFVAELNADSDLYASVVGELKALEATSVAEVPEEPNPAAEELKVAETAAVVGVLKPATATSVVTTELVPANIWSVYVMPDKKGGLTSHIGTSRNPGTALVFTHGDAVIKYRLDCGFQILHETPPPGFPQCEDAECNPTPPCEETGTCEPPCQEVKCVENSVTPPQGWTPMGPGQVQPTAPPAKANPLNPSTPIIADPGPTVPVQGASPAPVAPPAPVIPQAPAPTDPGTPITDPDG